MRSRGAATKISDVTVFWSELIFEIGAMLSVAMILVILSVDCLAKILMNVIPPKPDDSLVRTIRRVQGPALAAAYKQQVPRLGIIRFANARDDSRFTCSASTKRNARQSDRPAR